jgi:hypothetical protein
VVARAGCTAQLELPGAQARPSHRLHNTAPAVALSAGRPSRQVLHTEEDLRAYLGSVPAAARLLGGDAAAWRFRPIADGAINSVVAVHSSTGASLLLKQAPPYVRSVGESFPLSQVSDSRAALCLVNAVDQLKQLASSVHSE